MSNSAEPFKTDPYGLPNDEASRLVFRAIPIWGFRLATGAAFGQELAVRARF
jgi:hypothetical protein